MADMERSARRLHQGRTGVPLGAVLAGAAAATGCLLLGLAQSRTSTSVDNALALTMWAIALTGTVAAAYQARSALVAAGALAACIIAFNVGQWLPYKLELWDLTIRDFETADKPGSDGLWVGLYFGTPFAIVVGFVIGFITRAVRLNWVDAASRPRDAAH